MKIFAVLLLAAQLLLSEALPSSQQRILSCDDPEVEQAAAVAVDYINSVNQHGYKFALNRIDNVKVHSAGHFGEIFEVDVDLLETKCHVSSPTPLKDCPVRPLIEHSVEGDCEVHLAKANGAFQVMNHVCKTAPESAEDVTDVCPGCALLAPLNDTNVVQAVDVSLQKFNHMGNQTHLFKLVEVGRAKVQNFPSTTVLLELAIVETNCSANTPSDLMGSCAGLSGDIGRHGFCQSTVSGAAVDIHCDIYNPKPGHVHIAAHKALQAHGLAHHDLPPVQKPSAPMHGPDHAQEPAHVPEPTPQVVFTHKHAKRTLVAPEAAPGAVPTFPRCPGRIRFF